MDFIKKNKIMVGAVAFIIVVLLVGVLLLKGSAQKTATTPTDQTQNVKKISPSEIGLNLSLNSNNTVLTMEATKVDGVKAIEYEVNYDAMTTEEGETANVPRGTFGELKINGSTTNNAKIDLGTCSSGTCKYDKITGDIKVILKVTYNDGIVASVEDSISLN